MNNAGGPPEGGIVKQVTVLVSAMVWMSAFASRGDEFAVQRERVLGLGRLTAPPAVVEAEGVAPENGVRAIYFESVAWKGCPTRVFAWLGLPDIRAGSVPGVVLVHGGGGTAFKEWVRRWNERGFAAISIATEGQTDEAVADGGRKVRWKRHDRAGPARGGIYSDSAEPLEDQWMYHAVAAAVLANNLLRSIPGVDDGKVGLSGISWGGVVTSTVMGIDSRFAFAIPIYGCGHMHRAENQWGRALESNAVYRAVWDPVLRMDRARMPALWLSWPEDKHFPLDSQAATYRAMAGPRMVSLIPRMGHSHPAGWLPPDSYAFAESVARDGKPWCAQTDARVDGGTVRVVFESSKPLDHAALIHTAGAGFTGDRRWIESPATLENRDGAWHVAAPLPQDATAWFVNVRSGDLTASSEYQESAARRHSAVPGIRWLSSGRRD